MIASIVLTNSPRLERKDRKRTSAVRCWALEMPRGSLQPSSSARGDPKQSAAERGRRQESRSPPHHVGPVSGQAAAQQAHRRIPGGRFALEHPAPIGGEGEQRPNGPPEGCRQMHGRVVGRNDQVEGCDLAQKSSRFLNGSQSVPSSRVRPKRSRATAASSAAGPCCKLKKRTPGT